MSAAFVCDRCGEFYKYGFTGRFLKSVHWGNDQYEVNLKIRKPHLCKKCICLFAKVMCDEIQESYADYD